MYDEKGDPFGFKYNDEYYVYIKNLKNDVVAIADKDRNIIVRYTYDSWGKLLKTEGTLANTIGKENPIRYRSYYYDTESGYYFLQSRYYDPNMCRFLNADGLVSTGQGVQSYNLFGYCLNNPIRMADNGGLLPEDRMLDNAMKYNRGEMYFMSIGGSGSPTPKFYENRKKNLSELSAKGTTVSKGSVQICTDGSDRSRVPDSDWQPYVALAKWTDTTFTTLDAYTMPYVVMPKSSDARYGAKLGDTALVINWDTLDSVWCIIGDIGPAWGEVSINVIWQIDNANHMTANHASGLSNNYEIIVYPGVSYDYDWSYGCRRVKR